MNSSNTLNYSLKNVNFVFKNEIHHNQIVPEANNTFLYIFLNEENLKSIRLAKEIQLHTQT